MQPFVNSTTTKKKEKEKNNNKKTLILSLPQMPYGVLNLISGSPYYKKMIMQQTLPCYVITLLWRRTSCN